MELQVTGCEDCPMCEVVNRQYSDCKLGRYSFIENKYIDGICHPITPSWCPLKTEPVIIALKT